MSAASKAAALAFAFVASVALVPTLRAQTPDLDAARVAQLEQELHNTRLRVLEAERQAYAAQAQLQTEQRLRDLAEARAAPTHSLLAATPPLPPTPPTAVVSIDSQLAADSERIMQLQERALARSNARILAVRPAL